MAIHTAGLPDVLADFVRRFYACSDDGARHDEYADFFEWQTDDDGGGGGSRDTRAQTAPTTTTTFRIGGMPAAQTRAQVVAWRRTAWQGVASRRHAVQGVYVQSPQSPQSSTEEEKKTTSCMLYGTVDYVKEASNGIGTESSASWAGLMVFRDESIATGDPRMCSYQVWITLEP